MWHCYVGFEKGNQFGVSEFWGGRWIFVCTYVLVWGTELAIFDTKILCWGTFGVGTRTHDVDNSLRILPCAIKPSTLKGCVGTLEGGYVHNVPTYLGFHKYIAQVT